MICFFMVIKSLRLDLPSFVQIRVVPIEAREYAFWLWIRVVNAWLCERINFISRLYICGSLVLVAMCGGAKVAMVSALIRLRLFLVGQSWYSSSDGSR
jgi:hypothetical protein